MGVPPHFWLQFLFCRHIKTRRPLTVCIELQFAFSYEWKIIWWAHPSLSLPGFFFEPHVAFQFMNPFKEFCLLFRRRKYCEQWVVIGVEWNSFYNFSCLEVEGQYYISVITILHTSNLSYFSFIACFSQYFQEQRLECTYRLDLSLLLSWTCS